MRAHRAAVGLLPSARIAAVQEVDSAWQALWRDQYSHHTDQRTRAAFEEAYKGWQRVKESIGAMNLAELMDPATGDMIERYNAKARDWRKALAAAGVPLTSPDIRPPKPPTNWNSLVWGLAATAGAVALALAIARLPAAKRFAVSS
jgi:hypothetical protein